MYRYYSHSGYSLNSTYLIILLILFAISIIVQIAVKSKYSKYSKVMSERGLTAADAAQIIFMQNGIQTKIASISGTLSDNYNPKTDTIYLSAPNSTSIAAIGVACHEAGHALQYNKGYSFVKFRTAILPVCSVASKLAYPLILVGIFLSAVSTIFKYAAVVGVILFAIAVFFQLVTLPVEFNASHRAVNCIREYNILQENEIGGVKSVLTAAALTYVVAMLMSFVQLLRFISIISGNRR